MHPCSNSSIVWCIHSFSMKYIDSIFYLVSWWCCFDYRHLKEQYRNQWEDISCHASIQSPAEDILALVCWDIPSLWPADSTQQPFFQLLLIDTMDLNKWVSDNTIKVNLQHVQVRLFILNIFWLYSCSACPRAPWSTLSLQQVFQVTTFVPCVLIQFYYSQESTFTWRFIFISTSSRCTSRWHSTTIRTWAIWKSTTQTGSIKCRSSSSQSTTQTWGERSSSATKGQWIFSHYLGRNTTWSSIEWRRRTSLKEEGEEVTQEAEGRECLG